MSKYSKTGNSTPNSDRFEYTCSDREHFEKLMNFPGAGAGAPADGGDSPDTLASNAFEYTESDARTFEKLMTFDPGRKGSRRSTGQTTRSAAAHAVHTDSDQRLFDELMSFEQNRVPTTLASPAKQPAPVPSELAYTRQDLEAFRKLMSDEQSGENQHASARDRRRASTDRDVGYIRIVDFDKAHSRENENKRRGNADMKIRFFD